MSPDKLDPIKHGFLKTFLAARAPINTSLLEKKIPFDDNNIIVTESISVLSPSDTPLDGKILFPDTKPPPSDATLEIRMYKLEDRMDHMENRMDKLQTQVSTIEQKLDLLLALFQSQTSSVPAVSLSAVSQIVQDTVSASPTTPSETLPVPENSPVLPPAPVISKTLPSVWNGTNSKVKDVASRSSPVAPTSNPQAKATAKPTPVPTVKASDPLPRSKVSPAHTLATQRVSPRRTTTSPPLVHHISRVADGEPDRSPRRLSNSSGN